MTEKQKFSHAIWAFDSAKYEFEESLENVGLESGTHYQSLGWDDYDNSIEIYGVYDEVRLTEAQQRIIYDAGFSIAFVNHKDGWETHYHWNQREPFKSQRGWRRRYVSDSTATTTNVIVGEQNPGYYEISYWPTTWGEKMKKDLDSGYFRIVPDPLEVQ